MYESFQGELPEKMGKINLSDKIDLIINGWAAKAKRL